MSEQTEQTLLEALEEYNELLVDLSNEMLLKREEELMEADIDAFLGLTELF